MGNSKLFELAERRKGEVRAAVRALHAELKAVEWMSAQEVLNSYPSAEVAGTRITIPLDEEHCIVIAINYSLGFALMEFAGERSQLREEDLASSEKQT